jgi:hypothetical protein
MRRAILTALLALLALAVPASAQAWTVQVTPTSIEKFGYGTGTGHTTNGNTSWTTVVVRSSDYNGSATHAVDQKWVGGSNGWQKQWDDGASLGLYETVTNDSELRTRFQFGTSGKAVGTYPTTWQFFNTGAGTSQNISLTAYVQPFNNCTDGLDNDNDGLVDWRKGAGGSNANADPDCTGMSDSDEGAVPPPPPDVQCGDGVDNDGDTLVDYPADPGCTGVTDDSENTDTPPPPGSWWKPTAANGPWYWQLTGALNTARANTVNVIDVDPDNVTATQIAAWKAARPAGQAKAICYVSAGTAENFRSDYQQFVDIHNQRIAAGDSNGILGAVLPEWPDERWLDGQDFEHFDHLIAARVDQCVADGFDGVEYDNVDGYTNDPGTLTANEQLTYNRALAALAHSKGLAAFLKNDVDQLAALQPDFDGAINEQCAQFNECDGYSVFTAANKPVLQAEYGTFNQTRCNAANAAGRWAAYYGLNLSGTTKYQKCWP